MVKKVPKKPIRILGISAFYHDSAACLIVDGVLVAAAQEERFSRIKHDDSFPHRASAFCLEEGSISMSDLNAVVFYDKPLLKLERVLETYLIYAPRGIRSFVAATLSWSRGKFFFRRMFRKHLVALGVGGAEVPILFSEHHLSHAASAFYPSPHTEAAILTIDGIGEWATVSIAHGTDTSIKIIEEIRFPHSLGLLYASFTDYLGFEVNSGEQKVMGLASYADPASTAVQHFKRLITEHLIDIKSDGSFALQLSYFDFPVGIRMTRDAAWEQLFAITRRLPEAALTQKHYDLACALQSVTEDILLGLARRAKQLTNAQVLCLAGGVALNCVANSNIRNSGIFEAVWIQPCSSDGGGSLGAALAAYYLYYKQKRLLESPDAMHGAYLGPAFSHAEIESVIQKHTDTYVQMPNEKTLCEHVATLLAEGNIVGWFQGKMEWGPRALGNRSILADPRNPLTRGRVNKLVKRRETFRPFGPSVLLEDVQDYFTDTHADPYMLFISHVHPQHRNPHNKETTSEHMFETSLSNIPAVTHYDYSSRVQTVSQDTNPLFYMLIDAFKKNTGCSLLLNTSFNVRDEPIVCSPEDAFTTFMNSELNVLVMGPYVILKKENNTKRYV